MPSPTYLLFQDAILAEKQVVCEYDGHRRELCPVILGHSNGNEKVLAYQVGGSSSRALPQAGAWKCLFLSRVDKAVLSDGPWREGEGHASAQTCVERVELDINIHVRRRRA